ncbi:hypothetical protein AAMO2058_000660100 [Amorphochlora amoebiformis]
MAVFGGLRLAVALLCLSTPWASDQGPLKRWGCLRAAPRKRFRSFRRMYGGMGGNVRLRGGRFVFSTKAHYMKAMKGELREPEGLEEPDLIDEEEPSDPEKEKLREILGDKYKELTSEDTERKRDRVAMASMSAEDSDYKKKKDWLMSEATAKDIGRAFDLGPIQRELKEEEIPDLPQDANQTALELERIRAEEREILGQISDYNITAEMQREVVTLAGSHKFKHRDGRGARARFKEPFSIACGNDGALFVVETQAHCIRRIGSDGVVDTYIGNPGNIGIGEGRPRDSLLAFPYGVAVDEDDRVFVADTLNQRIIRAITNEGQVHVELYAGEVDVTNRTDGFAMEAIFSYPQGLELDAASNVYVADTSHGMLRKISTDGEVTTLVGDGFGQPRDGAMSHARLGMPRDLCLDHNSGRLYFTDYAGAEWSRVRMLDENGVVHTVAGSTRGYVDGLGSVAKFGFPYGISVDFDGYVYVADAANHVIRRISPDFEVITFAGNGEGGICDGLVNHARFYGPFGVCVDEDNTVYVADTLNNRVRAVRSISRLRFIDKELRRIRDIRREEEAEKETLRYAAKMSAVKDRGERAERRFEEEINLDMDEQDEDESGEAREAEEGDSDEEFPDVGDTSEEPLTPPHLMSR